MTCFCFTTNALCGINYNYSAIFSMTFGVIFYLYHICLYMPYMGYIRLYMIYTSKVYTYMCVCIYEMNSQDRVVIGNTIVSIDCRCLPSFTMLLYSAISYL